jgi:hypothetical protein
VTAKSNLNRRLQKNSAPIGCSSASSISLEFDDFPPGPANSVVPAIHPAPLLAPRSVLYRSLRFPIVRALRVTIERAIAGTSWDFTWAGYSCQFMVQFYVNSKYIRFVQLVLASISDFLIKKSPE